MGTIENGKSEVIYVLSLAKFYSMIQNDQACLTLNVWDFLRRYLRQTRGDSCV